MHCSDGGGGSLGVDPNDVGGLPVDDDHEDNDQLSKKIKPPVDGLQPVVGSLSRRLDVVVVVVRETVAEPWRLDL